ncbi:hypothetical protein TI39_contig4117g00002 [Zymoseptoria brevis]|uniref:Ankyrin repeat protein n=1 Tax=Zymoseptoria brevis TaxID=1047168 RepID=A0A0F4GGN4_9PEZI|nr:hypothetical protein TI39_contig4117g00002 [Zymoseptoria brevis]
MAASLNAKPNELRAEAIKKDDPSLMEQAIEIASRPNFRMSVQDLIKRTMRRATANGAIKVLTYLLDHGADVEAVRSHETLPWTGDLVENDVDYDYNKPHMDVLEILVAHGWDVNTHEGDQGCGTLLWSVLRYPELVQWCLDHGARVDIPEWNPDMHKAPYNPPRFDADGTEQETVVAPRNPVTVLGYAARYASIETFELLRARGAPLDPRTLHIAAECNRLDMVRHLVDVVGLDVNAFVYHIGEMCTTPLCCLAAAPKGYKEAYSAVITFLLDRGADPDQPWGMPGSALYCSPKLCAEAFHGDSFLNTVKAWQAKQQGGGADESVPETKQADD